MRGLPDAAVDRASEAAPVDSGEVGGLASWQCYGQDGNQEGIFAQRYDASGNKVYH